ncbi:hematopoietic cell signal transducer isoform X1 [Peromyscus maniculatus bairdii]|uniref:hematopoietic cell signal transducer isoform X1 n=1 Tax=Peromyscus maniculatus bairdii TaxID=230844 RepID=UPI003FD52CB0
MWGSGRGSVDGRGVPTVLSTEKRTSQDHSLWPDPFRPRPAMTPPGHLLFLLLLPVWSLDLKHPTRPEPVLGTTPRPLSTFCLSTVAADQTPAGSCSGCGPLSLPLLAGLVAADAVLSLIIVGVVFVCMRPHSGPAQDSRVYINMPGRS